MCGIAGWYRRGHRFVSQEAIVGQCDRLYHRGPDDMGVLIDQDFGFGMRRLSIIDLAGGHQPISSYDGRYAIIANGEIVNHLELRSDLKRDYSFQTHSDTETLLASFIRWGDDAWVRLEGMYAAAIWDRQLRRLTLVRDPLGIKPLYVTEQSGGLAFASEISALRALPDHRFDLDDRAVHDFFSFGHVLKPRTMFRQIRSLDPGHVLHLRSDGEATNRCFWRAEFNLHHGLSEKDWIEETRERVLATVGRHMLSDVPVGAFLSGGVDSGAIAAAMARSSQAPFKLFTAGFPGSKIDETEAARQVAEHLGCQHIVLPIEPKTAAEILPAVQGAFDEPSAANSAIPLWYLSKMAAEHVKVVLCGEGGDELFLGYKRLRWAETMRRWAPMVRGMGGLRILDRLPELRSRRANQGVSYLKRFRDGALLTSNYQRFFAAVTITPPAVRKKLYEKGFWLRQDGPDCWDRLEEEYFPDQDHRRFSPIEQFTMGDLTVHMPASLLNRLDRASMAHSLEARVPFLSHRFVDWALTVPVEMKRRGNVGKYVLRRAVEPWLPRGAIDRPKLGFQMPLADWFAGDMNDFAREAWRSSGAGDGGYLDRAAVEALFDEHRRGAADHGRMLYALAMFSCWWKDQYLEKASASPRPLLRAS